MRMPQLAIAAAAQKPGENSTDKFGSSNVYFANTASDLAHWQISVDLFLFTHGKGSFKNVVTFSELSKKSNGNFFFYPEYSQY
jgi:hypothetical protein